MAGSATNIVINPVNVLWRIEASWQIDLDGLTASGLGGKYISLKSAKDAADYYVWFDENNTDVDPTPGGTAIPVDYGAGAAASVIAAAMQVAVDAVGDFRASVSGTVVTITCAAVGETTDPAGDSGAKITTCQKGKDFDLGLLQGEVSPSMAPANFAVQAHQTGLTTLGLINQGIESLEVATVLQETTKSKLKELYKIWGGVFTPGGGTEVFGVGTGIIGKNMLIEAARLEMHPVNSLSAELSYPYNFMLALPVPDSMTFSGENPRTLSVTWQGFPNLGLGNAGTNALIVGDATQVGL